MIIDNNELLNGNFPINKGPQVQQLISLHRFWINEIRAYECSIICNIKCLITFLFINKKLILCKELSTQPSTFKYDFKFLTKFQSHSAWQINESLRQPIGPIEFYWWSFTIRRRHVGRIGTVLLLGYFDGIEEFSKTCPRFVYLISLQLKWW